MTGTMLMGTPAYMAPEQARGDKMDARSDQYSLAVIIYQLFTGRLPFEGETPMQTAMKHLDEPVPPPQSVNPELSPALERVILTALSKDPQARFPSVRALNTAFLAALRGDPLTWLKPTRALQLDEKQPGQPRSGEEQGGRLVTRTLPLIGLLAAVLLAGGALFWLQEGEAMFPGGQAPEPTAEAGGSTLEGGTPTATPLPPTPTPVPTPLQPISSAQCPRLQMYGFTTQGNDAQWLIDNGTQRPVVLENVVDFSAPPENQAVEKVSLGEVTVFMGPAVEGLFTWLEGADRTIAVGEVERLTFTFAWRAASGNYSMELLFSGDCRLEGVW